MINLDDDWTALERSFPYAAAMRNCVQDPVHHAEGDVWTHTKMVANLLDRNDRVMCLTALYHDVCKPETRRVEWDMVQHREVIRHPYHAPLGAATAWYDLWLAGEDLQTRLAVYWLCKWHQRVFHMWDEKDMIRAALSFACVGSWQQLIEFALADNAGRICANPQHAADNLNLLTNWLGEMFFGAEAEYWNNEYDRIFYFEKPDRSPFYFTHPPQGSHVTVLSGLPGVGKDTHAGTVLSGLPVVSLDSMRTQMGIEPTDNQGRVVQAAFEQARVWLRVKKPFVWNAQAVTKQARDKIIGLCRAYDAHVTIHAFDRPLATVLRQNEQRERQVPEAVIMAAARKWEPPSLLEAHRLVWV